MRDFAIELFNRWTAMWNGDLELAEEIMAPEFTLRYAQPGAVEYDHIHDPKTFAAQIEVFRAAAPGLLSFEVQGLPIVEMDASRTGLIARPYGARIDLPDGTSVAVSGNDILRAENGLIVEVWSASGGLGGRSFY
ncbi:ester cyclase [Nocardia sp. NBC_01503]|uniref:nuclear transport factor 2 family protein n=1 Tax=Nocardia sp. NBC_01503 TaxID=2975997 RepID=UPI002E7ABDC7|nr:nuclear transport factor 2 family protein [Nocardia sp. NBC_01503]WTL31693.1 ester cyclase [Nocardia sp. NBC_01503]